MPQTQMRDEVSRGCRNGDLQAWNDALDESLTGFLEAPVQLALAVDLADALGF